MTASTITRGTDQLALARVKQIVARCRQGTLDPSNALHMIESYAPAIHVTLYDMAVDQIEQVAVDKAMNLEPVPHRVARVRKPVGPESDTRRARRHARKVHKPAAQGTGRALTARVEANSAERVTAAMEWRIALPKGQRAEAVSLRPIWAVTSDGMVDDAAYVFGTPKTQGLGLLGAGLYKGKVATPSRFHVATKTSTVEAQVIRPEPKRRKDGKRSASNPDPRTVQWHSTRTTLVKIEQDRRSERAGITPNLAYRVPSVPPESPLLEAKKQWLELRRTGSTAKAKERAKEYQRNGWAH